MAALLKRELGVDAELVHGSYGQFKIAVDGREVLDGGAAVILGVVPSNSRILAVVGRALESPEDPA